MLAAESAGHLEEVSSQANHQVFLRIRRPIAQEDDFRTGKDQKHPEDMEDPIKTRDRRRAQADHHAAHDERAEDAPEQYPVLVGERHAEIGEDHRDHKDIVHGKG